MADKNENRPEIDIHEFSTTCVKHAEDLLASAKTVHKEGHSNIAYHLAALSLEEIGKRELFGVHRMSSKRDEQPSWPRKHMDNHVQKLFWAFFTVDFGRKPLTKESLDFMSKISTDIHETRLAGLYVSGDRDNFSPPKEMVTLEDTERLIDLAESRIGMAKTEQPRKPTLEEIETQQWFLRLSENDEWRRLIFGKKSMEKLAEFGSPREWVKWLKDIYEEQERENRELAEAEIARSKGKYDGDGKEKWKLKVRLFSDSHKIRPKELRTWNEKVTWIKLRPVTNKKNEILIEFTFTDHTSIAKLYWLGWGVVRHLVVALNIATMGFFWWDRSRQIERYYEKIEDLESKAEIRLDRKPSLKADWGENRILTDEELLRAVECFAALPQPDENERHTPFDYYIGGLTFLGINDIHWQCESNIFGNFYKCLQEMMAANGEWKKGEPFKGAFETFLRGTWPDIDDAELYLELGKAIDSQRQNDRKITIKEAVTMKMFCDAYFMIKYKKNHMPDFEKNNLEH